MYTATCDGVEFYNPSLDEEAYAIFDPVLTIEDNKAGSFEFSMAATNVCFSGISILKNRICVYKDGTCCWEGRPLTIEMDWNNTKRIVCEGRIAELRDCMMTVSPITVSQQYDAPYVSTDSDIEWPTEQLLPGALEQVFERYNAFIDDSAKEIHLGSCDIPFTRYSDGTDYTTKVCLRSENAETTIFDLLYSGDGGGADQSEANPDCIFFPALTEAPYNAHILPRYEGTDPLYVDILEDVGELSSQTIEFGKNLLDITQYIKSDEAFSVIYPIFLPSWNKEDGLKRYLDGTYQVKVDGSVVTGKTLTNETFVNVIGRVVKAVYIYYYSWSQELSTQDQRDAIAAEYLAQGLASATTVEITALDLEQLGVDVDAINLLDYYEIISEPHGFEAVYQCSGMTLDLDEPQNNTYQFGPSRQTLTSWITEAIKAATPVTSIDDTTDEE